MKRRILPQPNFIPIKPLLPATENIVDFISIDMNITVCKRGRFNKYKTHIVRKLKLEDNKNPSISLKIDQKTMNVIDLNIANSHNFPKKCSNYYCDDDLFDNNDLCVLCRNNQLCLHYEKGLISEFTNDLHYCAKCYQDMNFLYNLTIYMKIHKKKYENGMMTITIPVKSANLVSFGFLVRVGSRDEDEKSAGVAHFLEHIIFKGTHKRPGTEIINELDSLGIEYNAMTSFEFTFFYLTGHPDDFKKIFDIISDIYINPKISNKEIEKERKIIIQEYYTRVDLPSHIISKFAFETLFKGSTLGRDIIGTLKTINGITKKDIVEFRNKHYQPINTLFMCVGSFDKDLIDKMMEKKFSELTNHPLTVPSFSYIHDDSKIFNELFAQKSPRIFIKKTPGLKHCRIMMTYFITDFIYDEYGHELEMLSDLLTRGLHSVLKITLRERDNLIYSINSRVYNHYGISYFTIETSAYPQNAQEIVISILKEINNIKKNGIDRDDFKKIKKMRIIDNLQPMNKTPMKIMYNVAMAGLFDYDHILGSNKEIAEKIKQTKLKTLNTLFDKIFNIKHLNVFILGDINKSNIKKKLV